MKAFFTSSAVSSSSGSAAQPAIISWLVGSSAEQPARETAQPVKASRSITDVQWWLKNNEVVLSSSAEAVRIREVVEALGTKPKPRQETIECFFKPWGVPQRIKQKHRPVQELIQELNTKVTIAAKELQQQLADRAERPLLLSHSAEQPALEAAQPVKASCSITDVQWWLKNNEAVLSSSAEAMRIREVF